MLVHAGIMIMHVNKKGLREIAIWQTNKCNGYVFMFEQSSLRYTYALILHANDCIRLPNTGNADSIDV